MRSQDKRAIYIVSAIILLALRTSSLQAYEPPICPHVLGWTNEVRAWAKGAPWIKVLDVTGMGIAKQLGAKVFYRPFDQSSKPDGDPALGGAKMGKDVLARLSFLSKKDWPDAISFQNEFNNVSPETAKAFMDYYDTLRAGGYDGLIVFGSYGPGGPTDSTEWGRPYIKAAIEKADAVETHEYWDLTIASSDTWLAHRHVRALKDYPYLQSKPWFIGEFGSDAVNQGEDKQKRDGWRDRNKLTEDEFIKQIEIYRHGDAAHGVVTCADNVMAVFLYQQGSKQWERWEVMGTKVANYMKTTWPPTVGYITGKVTDKKDKPVEGATVTLLSTHAKVKTDKKGVYWFFGVAPGSYEVKVSKTKTGHVLGGVVSWGSIRGKNDSVYVTAGDIENQDFQL